MSLKIALRSIAAGALLASAASSSAAAMDRAEVEKIVHDYLLANPQILNEMIVELQKRDEAATAEKSRTGIEARKAELLNDGYSYVAGNPNGDVTVVEFFDYRCGYCKRVRADLLSLIESDSGVRVVLKELPILSEASHEAAKAAMASIAQGGDHYWRFHQALLAADGLDSAAIYDVAAEVGLDVARLKKDMADPKIEANLAQTKDLAGAIGVEGTPAFVIDGQLMPGARSVDDLKAAVAAARKGG